MEPLLVTLADDLEEQVGADFVDGQISKFVDAIRLWA